MNDIINNCKFRNGKYLFYVETTLLRMQKLDVYITIVFYRCCADYIITHKAFSKPRSSQSGVANNRHTKSAYAQIGLGTKSASFSWQHNHPQRPKGEHKHWTVQIIVIFCWCSGDIYSSVGSFVLFCLSNEFSRSRVN